MALNVFPPTTSSEWMANKPWKYKKKEEKRDLSALFQQARKHTTDGLYLHSNDNDNSNPSLRRPVAPV